MKAAGFWSAGLFTVLAVRVAAGQVLAGTVQQQTFVGPVSGATIVYNVYLPPEYAPTGPGYPVIYHLHGLGGNQGGNQVNVVPALFEDATTLGLIGKVIIVFPNGYTNAFWADSINGAKPAETNVITELVPHVDATYNTVPNRRYRVIEGFSMGGFGAAKFITKFPHRFSTCVVYDGALVTWSTLVAFNPQIAAEIFGNDEDYFNLFSPWWHAPTNADLLGQHTAIRFVAGRLGGNVLFNDLLIELGLQPEFFQSTCRHMLPCLLDQGGPDSVELIASRLPTALDDLDLDHEVDLTDVQLFVGCLAGPGAGTPGPDCDPVAFANTDLDGDSDTDLKDVAIFQAAFDAGE